jgi:hypothetical protein
VSWDELVAAALVGTDRRPVDPQPPPGLEAAFAGEDGLLAAAAAWTVARRAGAEAGPARAVEPAPVDERPLCPRDAGMRLGGLLEEGAGRLVEEWLELAEARGVRPPPEHVPALLEWASGVPERQPLVVGAAGPLGPWLSARAAHAPSGDEWQMAGGERWTFVPGAADPQRVWADGDRAARRVLLARLRATDPAAGRELLAGTLAEESADDRAAFLQALETGLSDDDEPLLEAALDDRRQTVRAAAAELLARLPRSRFAARMAERAAPLLTPDRRTLRVQLPDEPDSAARRDALPASRRRADVLAQILSRAPLGTWTERFGRSPEKILALDVADDYEPLVHGAFAIAAQQQRDPAWARALWRRQPAAGLLDVLPKAEREELALERDELEDIVASFPRPWGPELSRAVVARLGRLVKEKRTYAIAPDLAYGLDPTVLAPLEALREEGGARIDRLCHILATRAAMLGELS